MHCSELLHLAAIVLERAPVIIELPLQREAGSPTSAPGNEELMQCWSAIHNRLKTWKRQMTVIESPMFCTSRDVTTLTAELFISEPFSRLWAAIIACQQERHGLQSMAAVFRASLEQEDELRRRAVSIVLAGRSITLETALQLHRLRRFTSRIAQLQVESLASRYPTADRFGVNPLLRPPLESENATWLAPRAASPPAATLRRHWWSQSVRGAAPLRLLAQSLRSGPVTKTAVCSTDSETLVQRVLRCLPSDSLYGADTEMSPTLLSCHQLEQWGHPFAASLSKRKRDAAFLSARRRPQ